MAIKNVDLGELEVAHEPDMLYCSTIRGNVVLGALTKDKAFMLNANGLHPETFPDEAQPFLRGVALSDPEDLKIFVYGAGMEEDRTTAETYALREVIERTIGRSGINPNLIQDARYTPNFKELSLLLVPELGEYFIQERPINDHERWELGPNSDMSYSRKDLDRMLP